MDIVLPGVVPKLGGFVVFEGVMDGRFPADFDKTATKQPIRPVIQPFRAPPPDVRGILFPIRSPELQ
jgi:hypothetical protein